MGMSRDLAERCVRQHVWQILLCCRCRCPSQASCIPSHANIITTFFVTALLTFCSRSSLPSPFVCVLPLCCVASSPCWLLLALLTLHSDSFVRMSSEQPTKKQKVDDQKSNNMSSATTATATNVGGAQDISLDVPPPSANPPPSDLKSWVAYDPNTTHFPIQNLPYGVFSKQGEEKNRIGVAIGDQVLDLHYLASEGLLSSLPDGGLYFAQPTLNAFMERPRAVWSAARALITDLLKEGGNPALRENAAARAAALVPQSSVRMHLPARIGDYTDFYSSKFHAFNVGVMFRGRANALQPNWTWLPVGYHGRSSSVVVSGTPIHRPHGQLQLDAEKPPTFGTCRLLDFELEMAAFVGGPTNKLGQPLTVEEAEDRLFGLVVMNDWSARDIQKWEYVPLGPFTAKNFATSISPWIVTMDALAPFRVPNQEQIPKPMDYLAQKQPMAYDIHLDVTLKSSSMSSPHTISKSNAKYLYWTLVQQLVHHSVTGCSMVAGDLLGTGTISGPQEHEYGSMLELSWKGSKEIKLGEEKNGVRKFIQDGDSINMIGYAQGPNYKIGFGECEGTILPPVKYP